MYPSSCWEHRHASAACKFLARGFCTCAVEETHFRLGSIDNCCSSKASAASMGGEATHVLLGVSVARLPRSFSLTGIQYASSLAEPKGLTLYRFDGAREGSSVACPDEHYQPPDDPDAAAESAAEMVRSMRLPPFLRDDASFLKGRVDSAQLEARRGICKWQVISAEQVEELIHKSQHAASTADKAGADSDDSEDEEPGAREQAIIGHWLASVYGDGIFRLNASFRQACAEAEQHWKDNMVETIQVSPEVLIVGGH